MDAKITDQTLIDAVWNKGEPVKLWPDMRRDMCGALMRKSSYGVIVDFGWDIGYIIPLSKGGTDDLKNLIPLEWRNLRAKGDMPDDKWKCAVWIQ